MIEELSKAIGKDITGIMKSKGVSDYYIWCTCKLCTEPTLSKIKKGKYKKSLPLGKIIDLYKLLGEKDISILGSDIKFIVKL